jgi:hypothetical protein
MGIQVVKDHRSVIQKGGKSEIRKRGTESRNRALGEAKHLLVHVSVFAVVDVVIGSCMYVYVYTLESTVNHRLPRTSSALPYISTEPDD